MAIKGTVQTGFVPCPPSIETVPQSVNQQHRCPTSRNLTPVAGSPRLCSVLTGTQRNTATFPERETSQVCNVPHAEASRSSRPVGLESNFVSAVVGLVC